MEHKIDLNDPVIRKYVMLGEIYGKDEHKAKNIYENLLSYSLEDLIKLYRTGPGYALDFDRETMETLHEEYLQVVDTIKPLENPQLPVYLWPEGKMPQKTVYTENPEHKYSHDPDLKPCIYEVLLPEDVEPKGAVVICPGGEQSFNVLPEGLGSAIEMREKGYQCFLLLDRPNGCPWSTVESGADGARAIRYIRAHAKEYRIEGKPIAFAGFSNGGLTGDSVIRYYSGEQTVKDSFEDYEPDELDEYYGSPDVFIVVYGPRFNGSEYDYSKVKYPPTMFAVGMDDFAALPNLEWHAKSLHEQKVYFEVHTFAGVPHGEAGRALTNGGEKYPGFAQWTTLSDLFIQNAWDRK